MEENRFDLELVAETVTHLRVTVKKGDEYARGVIYGGVREVGSMAVGSMEAVELDENGSGRLVMPEVSCRGGYYDVYYYDAERGYECKLVWGKIVATPRLAPAMSEQLVEFEAGVPLQDGGEVVVQMAVGERGEKGEKGEKGDKGEQGEPGVPGDVWGEIRLKDADIVPMYELGVSSYGIDFYYTSGSGMRYAGRLGLEESEYNGGRALKLHNDMPLVIGGTRFNPELMGGAVISSDGTLIFNSPGNGGDTVSIHGATALETVYTGSFYVAGANRSTNLCIKQDYAGKIVYVISSTQDIYIDTELVNIPKKLNVGNFTAKSATFSGDVTTGTGIHALPLGKKTALGADAYGLSVSADGGLQLFGNHFLLSDGWSDTALKVVNNAVGLTSTDEASLSFDYANTVHFRTMPNDGDGNGVYVFECYKWMDDSHTTKEQGYVDVRKKAAMSPTDESLLNRSENDARYGKLAGANEWSGVQTIYAPDGKYGANKIIQIRDASGEYPGYNICFRNGGSLEIFDESQDPTRHEPYFQIWRPGNNRTYACQNFCVKGTTEMRKAVTLTSSSSLTANCPATFQKEVLAMDRVKLAIGGDKTKTVQLTTGSIYDGQVDALVVEGAIKTGCIIQCCHLETNGNIWSLVDSGSASANFMYSLTDSQFVMSRALSVPGLVVDGKTIDELVEEKVTAILTEKGLI